MISGSELVPKSAREALSEFLKTRKMDEKAKDMKNTKKNCKSDFKKQQNDERNAKKVADRATVKVVTAEIENVSAHTNTISPMPSSIREKRQMGLSYYSTG